MKIEAGKKYKMRGGDVAYVSGLAPDDFDCEYPILGYILCTDGSWNDAAWKARNGAHTIVENKEHLLDIIAEYHEPVKRTLDMWVNVYEDGKVYLQQTTRESADRLSYKGRIACLHIVKDYVAGEGL